jgi:hypothetical protein
VRQPLHRLRALDRLLAERLQQRVTLFGREWPAVLLASGGCRGVDRLGEDYAVNRGLLWTAFPADWKRHDRGAGPVAGFS